MGNLRALSATFVCVCVCALGFVSSARAQNAQGTILGHITDPTGSPVANATVTIRNLGTNISRKATTSDLGDYVFVNVQPGRYDITAELSGFKLEKTEGVALEVGHTLRQDFKLSVGTLQEEVSVSASSQMVQSDDATIGNVISAKVLEELPLSGRDFTNLLRIQAGATTTGGGVAWAWTMHGLNTDFLSTSINGSRSESISYLVDGINSNDQFFASQSAVPSTAAVTEFKVQNGMYSAEFGQGSAQVNVAVRSGTNEYHGQAYDYLQNDVFEPKSPLNQFLNETNPGPNPLPLKNPFRQNQFGFTLGGPFVIPKLYNGRNKSFWFFGWEDGLQRSVNAGRVVTPTAAERGGNFSDWPWPIYDPATTGQAPKTADNPAGRLPFPGNIIPADRINSISKSILNYLPTANVACVNPCTSGGNYQATLSRPWDTGTITIRGDQNFSDMDRVFFTGILSEQKFSNPSLIPLTGETKYTRQQLFGLNWQHTFTPSIFNEFRVGYTFQHFEDASQTSFGPDISTQLGFQNVPNVPAFYGPPVVSFNGYQTLGNGNSAWSQNAHTYQFIENLKLIHGRHTLTLGADIRRLQVDLIDGYGAMGSLTFSGAYTASNPAQAGSSQGPGLGNAIADLLLGYPQSVGSPSPVPGDHYDVRGTNWNFFVQDDIRLTPRLTVNVGLRYEIPPAFHALNNSGVALDRTNGGGFLWADPKFTQLVSQAPGVNQDLIRCCVDNKLIEPDHKDFAPRIGFAWRPFSTNRFVVRGGYGIFYDIYARYYELTTFDDNSIYTAPSVTYLPASGLESVSPLALNTLWQPFPSNANDFSFFKRPGWQAGLQVNWPDNRSPRTQQWSFGTQFAPQENMLLDVSYVGSHAQHENGYWYFNAGYLPSVAGDQCNIWRSTQEAQSQQPSCLTDPNFQPVNTRDPYPNINPRSYANANVFWSNYNSLQVRLNQRFQNGLQYQVNYTYSKYLDVISEIGLVFGVNSFLQDPHNFRGDYGPSAFDQTHRVTALGSYELPVGKGKRWSLGKANWVLGNWQVSGVYTVATGMPFSVFAYNDAPDQIGLSRLGSVRPNLVGDPHSGPQTTYQWFNPAAFAAPELGRFGNVGRNTLRTPYYEDLDFTVGKNFRISERAELKYKLEIFNVGSNWHSNENMLYPNSNLTSSPAGCTPGPAGNCAFGSLVPLNGAGTLNQWNPRTLQMSLLFAF